MLRENERVKSEEGVVKTAKDPIGERGEGGKPVAVEKEDWVGDNNRA